MYRKWSTQFLIGLLVVALLAAIVPTAVAKSGGKISKFGVYSGYSEAIYDNWTRSSQYVEVRDGTKLAVDIFRPLAENDQVVEDPLPVVWTAERYRRAFYNGPYLVTTLDSSPFLTTLLQHGYVVASVDIRGTGASFGEWSGSGPVEAWDSYDMTEWFAAQSWCNGNVGMFGASYRGINQYWAAVPDPPHLKCIFPEVACFDGYFTGHPNGILWDRFLRDYEFYNYYIDVTAPAVAVDGDNGTLLAAAVEQHKNNLSAYAMAQATPLRNSWNSFLDEPVATRSTETFLNSVRSSGVAAYHWSGWYDYFVFTQPLWYANLDNPQKMAIGPWVHGDRYGVTDLAAVEHLRWYDYWLKGIDNGIMDEAPIHYYTIGASEGREWRPSWTWPVSGTKSTRYYLGGGTSGSVGSLNDGRLVTSKPWSAAGEDSFVVENFTLPLDDRWSATLMTDVDIDYTALDNVSLTYTTAALKADTRVTGYPVAHLWVSCNVTDADFFVYLEEVDAAGRSVSVSDGILRASHRATSTAPWDVLGLPWHRGNSGDVTALTPGEPVELQIALAPTSNIFDRGNRIRVTVTCTDWADMFDTPREPGAEVTIYRSRVHASYITLPIGSANGFRSR